MRIVTIKEWNYILDDIISIMVSLFDLKEREYIMSARIS